jgi:hypothetical protein
MADDANTETAARNQSDGRFVSFDGPKTPVTGVAPIDELIRLLGVYRINSHETINGRHHGSDAQPGPGSSQERVKNWEFGSWTVPKPRPLGPPFRRRWMIGLNGTSTLKRLSPQSLVRLDRVAHNTAGRPGRPGQ